MSMPTEQEKKDLNVVKSHWVTCSSLQLQLNTAKSQYWLHKAGTSPEHWQFKIYNLHYESLMKT